MNELTDHMNSAVEETLAESVDLMGKIADISNDVEVVHAVLHDLHSRLAAMFLEIKKYRMQNDND